MRRLFHFLGVLTVELMGIILFLTLLNSRIAAESSIRVPKPPAINAPFQYGVQPWTTNYPAALNEESTNSPLIAEVDSDNPAAAH